MDPTPSSSDSPGRPSGAARRGPGPGPRGDTPPLVELRGLVRRFEEGDRVHTVLDGADVTVGPGEFVVLLGPSGSGKSTLLNLVSGIDTPDGGVVRVDGRDLTALSERERTLFRRRHIGFVFQFFNLLPTLTVRENLLLPVELKGRVTPEEDARALDLLDAVGLADRGDTFPDRLSGGEQQRVAVARALVHEPLLVLADEPTGNLDEETGEQVLDLLDRLVRRAGKSLLAVTHSRSLAERADRVLTLDHGKVRPAAGPGVGDGPRREPRSSPRDRGESGPTR